MLLYAGPDSANHAHNGFSRNLSIHISILSKCHVVDEVLKNIL
ncbi:MAG: hypothetical protein Q8S84_04180 [bacterium]|nr:hypothetical protein [bacterium]MDP3380702.1 hypothetical protein [bacterium]